MEDFVVVFARKEGVFIAEKPCVFVLGEELTVVKTDKKSIVVDIRRKEFLQKVYALSSAKKPSSRRSFRSSLRRSFAFVEKSYRPAILAFRAQKVIIFVRAGNSYGVGTYVRSDIKFFHNFSFLP